MEGTKRDVHPIVSKKRKGREKGGKMTSTFSFGFSGDDIDVDESEINDVVESTQGVSGAQQESASALPELVQPERHDVEEWVGLSFLFLFALLSCLWFGFICFVWHRLIICPLASRVPFSFSFCWYCSAFSGDV